MAPRSEKRPDIDRGSATRDRRIRRVIVIEGAANLLVLTLKLGVGLTTGSLAILADAAHSLSDVANNAVAWLVHRASTLPPDHEHPYGHRKFETLAVFALAGLLTVLAVEVLRAALVGPHSATRHEHWGLAAMAAVLCTNVGLATWERRWARELDSPILHADASHTFADVLTTIAVILGWQASAQGWPWVDRACAVAVALLILRLAFDLFRRALPVLLDAAALDPDRIEAVATAVDGVLSIGNVRSRSDGSGASVDLVVRVDPSLSTVASHDIADRVEHALQTLCSARDVTVHIEPERSR